MRLLRTVTSGSVLMLLAAVLGIGTSAAAYVWLGQQAAAEDDTAARSTEDEATYEVVVLLEDVAAGTRLPRAALGLRDVPESQVLPGAATNLEAVAERVARYPMFAGEQVTTSRLVGEDSTGTGLAYTVPPGMRAVSVPLSEVAGAGGLIVPGDRVDVMVVTEHRRVFGPTTTVEAQDNDQDREPTVVTVLQDILVLAVGQELADAVEGVDASTVRADDVDPQPKAVSVTLAVTPSESQVLFMASHDGPLGFAVRSFGDSTRDVLRPVTLVEPATDFSRVERRDGGSAGSN